MRTQPPWEPIPPGILAAESVVVGPARRRRAGRGAHVGGPAGTCGADPRSAMGAAGTTRQGGRAPRCEVVLRAWWRPRRRWRSWGAARVRTRSWARVQVRARARVQARFGLNCGGLAKVSWGERTAGLARLPATLSIVARAAAIARGPNPTRSVLGASRFRAAPGQRSAAFQRSGALNPAWRSWGGSLAAR